MADLKGFFFLYKVLIWLPRVDDHLICFSLIITIPNKNHRILRNKSILDTLAKGDENKAERIIHMFSIQH